MMFVSMFELWCYKEVKNAVDKLQLNYLGVEEMPKKVLKSLLLLNTHFCCFIICFKGTVLLTLNESIRIA